MMKKALAVFAVLLGFAAVAGAEPKAHPDTTGWDSLFAGDLSNADFPKGVWSVKDGELSATKDQAIWTKDEYENFTVDLEFKTTEHANAGVLVYCTDKKNWIPNAVEIQLFDDHSVDWTKKSKTSQCGAIYGHLAPTKSVVKKPGEWNHMTVVCKGKHISVTLNGELITEMDMSKWTSAKKNPDGSDIPAWFNKPYSKLATKGLVGLQGRHAKSPVYYRNVKVKKS
jgi:hypothetical protein